MKAIILAAGVGNRLKPVTDRMPKSLIRTGGKTILERMLDSLAAEGVRDISVVIGHLKEMIVKAAGEEHNGSRIRYIENKEYRLGSIVSLWAAREEFSDGDVLLMDADVIFEPRVLNRLIGSKHKNCFLMDKNFSENGEEMKVAVLSGKVVQIARRITREHDEIGEGIGFFKTSSVYRGEFLKAIDVTIALNRAADYEEALDNFIRRVPAGSEEVTGLKWTEIDFPEDVKKAESLELEYKAKRT